MAVKVFFSDTLNVDTPLRMIVAKNYLILYPLKPLDLFFLCPMCTYYKFIPNCTNINTVKINVNFFN